MDKNKIKELGSWRVDTSANLNMNRRLVVDENGYSIAKVCYQSDPDKMDFLANLLASVPVMVKALKRIAEKSPGEYELPSDDDSPSWQSCEVCGDMQSIATIALAKCGIEIEP